MDAASRARHAGPSSVVDGRRHESEQRRKQGPAQRTLTGSMCPSVKIASAILPLFHTRARVHTHTQHTHAGIPGPLQEALLNQRYESAKLTFDSI